MRKIRKLWLKTPENLHKSLSRIAGAVLREDLSIERARALATIVNCKLSLLRFDLEKEKFKKEISIQADLEEIRAFLSERFPKDFKGLRIVKNA